METRTAPRTTPQSVYYNGIHRETLVRALRNAHADSQTLRGVLPPGVSRSGVEGTLEANLHVLRAGGGGWAVAAASLTPD